MAKKQLLYTVHDHFGTVRLFKEQELGHGSFATVCRAQCDDLPCAAKVLHANFFDLENPDPGEDDFISKFVKECNILPGITHPNIVQCFGTYEDPETNLPVLLMELMDESLTDYLKRSKDPLPFHTEVSFSYDVALGLSYLHSRGYVHRDLSSNNVLIMAGVRAKITDFGMCRTISAHAQQTLCPGTQPYMSPEALVEPPVYTDKLDVFSFGVLMVQIMSRKFPEPGPAHRALRTMLLQAIPEEERREKHIRLISQEHQLLPLAKQCIQNSPKVRPTSHEICNRLRVLKESHGFEMSQLEDGVQHKLEKMSALHELDLQRLQCTHQEEILNLSQQISDYQEQLRIILEHKHEQASADTFEIRPLTDRHVSDTGNPPFDPLNLPEPAFDLHDLSLLQGQEASVVSGISTVKQLSEESPFSILECQKPITKPRKNISNIDSEKSQKERERAAILKQIEESRREEAKLREKLRKTEEERESLNLVIKLQKQEVADGQRAVWKRQILSNNLDRSLQIIDTGRQELLQSEAYTSLDNQPRQGERAHAFSNTSKSEKTVKPVAESTSTGTCVSKTSETSLCDSILAESYMYNKVAEEIHNTKPCWYCTNLTKERQCEVCGHEQPCNKETTV